MKRNKRTGVHPPEGPDRHGSGSRESGIIDESRRKSGQEHDALFFNNPLPMWIYDLETLAFLEVNNAAIAKYGYSRDEFLSMTIKDIRPPEDVPRLLENISRVDGGLENRHRVVG